jgi:biopolymer transport protein ExbD
MVGDQGFAKFERKKPELSIAPLIDVIFLLLIFFMVTTTFTKETGVKINKPVAKKTDVLLDQNMLIAVTEKGEYFHDNQRLSLDGVRAAVYNRILEYPDTNVVILADKKSITEWVVDALDEAKQAGAKKISIAAKIEIEAQ